METVSLRLEAESQEAHGEGVSIVLKKADRIRRGHWTMSENLKRMDLGLSDMFWQGPRTHQGCNYILSSSFKSLSQEEVFKTRTQCKINTFSLCDVLLSVTNHHQLSGLKQHECIVLQFWRAEAWK